VRRPEYDTSETYWASVGPRILSYPWPAHRNKYDLLGLQAPERKPNSSELAFKVQTAIGGFTQQHLTEGSHNLTPTEAACLLVF
jgi:hypothetical protein